eukprot:tig00021123_g18512.t1
MASKEPTTSGTIFKKFGKDEISTQNLVKSSVQRGIRSSILAQMPAIEPIIDDILPKKSDLVIAKCEGHISLVCIDKEPLFFQERDGPFFPTLRLLHKYPFILPHMQCDKGAIKFVIGGANVMCPGLTSKGAKMAEVPGNSAVAVMAEGKQHAMAVGLTRWSSEEIRKTNKDIGVFNMHYLGDGLWKNPRLD